MSGKLADRDERGCAGGLRAPLEMHPIDDARREAFLRDNAGIGLCNITKCCTEVCPENIHITDNAIIPLKERVVDRFYDPVLALWRMVTGKKWRRRRGLARSGRSALLYRGTP